MCEHICDHLSTGWLLHSSTLFLSFPNPLFCYVRYQVILIKTLLIIVREGLCSRFDTWILDERIFWSLLIEKKVGVSFSTGVTVFDRVWRDLTGQNLVDTTRSLRSVPGTREYLCPVFFTWIRKQNIANTHTHLHERRSKFDCCDYSQRWRG